jgi:hypothetical protein
MKRKKIVVGVLILAALPLVSCHRAKQYEATVELTRISAIRKDEQGAVLTSDVEFSYFECPGTQIEVIRGGKEFSSCVQHLKVGEKVKIKLEHKWDPEGFYDYDVFEVQGCKRPPDPNDEASYKMVRECNDWNVNGTRVGFQCNYSNKKELNKKCPWFMKR